MKKQYVKCSHEDCENEFIPGGNKNKAGFIHECHSCGLETENERGNSRPGGVMEYAHKTAPTIKIMSLNDASSIQKKLDRVGGQGIIKGLSERR